MKRRAGPPASEAPRPARRAGPTCTAAQTSAVVPSVCRLATQVKSRTPSQTTSRRDDRADRAGRRGDGTGGCPGGTAGRRRLFAGKRVRNRCHPAGRLVFGTGQCTTNATPRVTLRKNPDGPTQRDVAPCSAGRRCRAIPVAGSRAALERVMHVFAGNKAHHARAWSPPRARSPAAA